LQIGQLASFRQPVYPVEAVRAHVEGTVELRVMVDQSGTVENIRLVSGPPLLVPTAITAVKQWRYGRTALNGRAVESVEDVSVTFRLGNSAASPG
jgi:protein TonB